MRDEDDRDDRDDGDGSDSADSAGPADSADGNPVGDESGGTPGGAVLHAVARDFGSVLQALRDMHVYVSGQSPPYRLLPLAGRRAPAASEEPAASVVAARHQPGMLLDPARAVVPFQDGNGQLGELAKWRDGDAATAVRLLHAPAGQGKTRLAGRFGEESQGAGWRVRCAVPGGAPAGPAVPPGLAFSVPAGGTAERLLVVVDDTERWASQDLHRLVVDLAPTAPRTRFLLLARNPTRLWGELGADLDELGARLDAERLPALAGTPAERAAEFAHARTHFARELGIADAEAVTPPDGLAQDDAYDSVLTVHMAALAALDAHLRGEPLPAEPAALTGRLLRREFRHWQRLREGGGPPTDVMARLVYTAILAGPLPHDEAAVLLVRTGLAADRAAALTLLHAHAAAYPWPSGGVVAADPRAPDGRALEPLRPDLLGEDFVALLTPGGPPEGGATPWALTAPTALLAAGGDPPPYTRQAVGVLVAAAERWPHAHAPLDALLRARPEIMTAAGSAALIGLTRIERLDPQVLDAVEQALPYRRSTDLDVGAAALAAHVLPRRIAAAPEDGAARAELLSGLSRRLSHAARHEEALPPAAEAERIWRGLAAGDPHAHRADHARGLHHLGQRLAELGDWRAARTATAAAVTVRRALLPSDPALHRPALAHSLTALADQLHSLGDDRHALSVTERAVALLRDAMGEEAAACSAGGAAEGSAPGDSAYAVDLAGALNNQAVLLLAVRRRAFGAGGRAPAGLRGRALGAAREAVELLRAADRADGRRAKGVRPDAYRAELATALATLAAAVTVAAEGPARERGERARAAAEEAVLIQGELARLHPAGHRLGLVACTYNLGTVLRACRDLDGAAAAFAVADRARAELAGHVPPGLLPDRVQGRRAYMLRLITRTTKAAPFLLLRFPRGDGDEKALRAWELADRGRVPEPGGVPAAAPGAVPALSPVARAGHWAFGRLPGPLKRGIAVSGGGGAPGQSPLSQPETVQAAVKAVALVAAAATLVLSLHGDSSSHTHPAGSGPVAGAPPSSFVREQPGSGPSAPPGDRSATPGAVGGATGSPGPPDSGGGSSGSTGGTGGTSGTGGSDDGGTTGSTTQGGDPSGAVGGQGSGGSDGGQGPDGGASGSESGSQGGSAGGGHGGGAPPPAPTDPVWGFAQDTYVTDPVHSTHLLGRAAPHDNNNEANWTTGTWAVGQPAPPPTPSATHLAVGRHLVVLPGIGTPGGVVHVTAYGESVPGGSCRPVTWGTRGGGAHPDEAIEVACDDRTGTPRDIPFDVLFLAGTGTGAHTLGEPRGWVHADRPTTASYLPAAQDAHGVGRITRDGRGRYTVGVDQGARAVQLTTVGATPGDCALAGLTGGHAAVVCTTVDGAAADLPFALSYTGRQSLLDDARRPHGAYLSVADTPGAAAPSVTDRWLSKSGAPTLTRTATGRYEIHLPLGYLPSYTHVTAHAGARCTLTLRNDYSRRDDAVLRVSCAVPASGAATDSGFDLTYMTASVYG